MISPVLFLLVMGVMEVAMVRTAQTLLESATFSASRVGKTGRTETDETQEQTIKAEISQLGKLLMNPAKITVTSYAYKDFNNVGKPETFIDANNNKIRDNGENYTDVNGNGQYDLDQGRSGYGAAEQIVVYTATYSWELFTPMVSRFIGTDGRVQITARAVVKNEPYS